MMKPQNETQKTLAFVGAAVLLALVAWISQPSPFIDQGDVLGEFFPDFTDPLAAQSLEITDYDEGSASLEQFKVAKVNGVWKIPSHSNYPADAARQMADAANSLIGVRQLALVGRSSSDHETYGVIDPTSPNLTASSSGVGKRVRMEDGKGNVLAQFIIGKTDPKQPSVQYVRIPGQDAVYSSDIRIDKLSTKFEDWIERDLLKLNSFDVKQVGVNDYSVDELQGSLVPRARIKLEFDGKDSKWKLDEMQAFKSGKWTDTPPAAGEELNSDKLNDLKAALDELQIVDVSPKPAGLAADLKVEDKLAKDKEGIVSLARHGFYVARVSEKTELFSNEGEVRCGTTEGVEYTLRFGSIAGADRAEKKDEGDKKEGDKKDESKKDDEKKDEAGGATVSRYILVTARFNDDLVSKPELAPLPGPEPAKPDDKKDESKKDDAKQDLAKPAAEKPAEAKPAEKVSEKKTAQKVDAPEAAKPVEKPAEQTVDTKPPAEVKADAAKPADKKPEAEQPKADPERERIERENKQKQDEYDTKVKEGKQKVKDLNARFATWYYVINDATYRKIHLGRDQVVKKKEPTKEEAEKADSVKKFNDLKSQGLDK
jgi:hypothetical protein